MENMDEQNPLNGTVLAFKPLVISIARRYAGRGAELEDLIQEGYRRLYILIPLCPDPEWLKYFLKMRLHSYIGDVAKKLRRKKENIPLYVLTPEGDEEQGEGFLVPDKRPQVEYERMEIRDMLRRVLSDEELDLVQAVMEGFTQKEIGEILGISHQAVHKRLRKIGAKLKPVMAEVEEREAA